MSDVLSKLGESLKTTIKEATEQTQKSVDQVSCRTDLLNKRNELKKLFERLGEAEYKLFVSEAEEADTVDRDTICEKITAIKTEIADLEKKLEEIVNAQKSSFDNYKRKVKTAWDELTKEEKKDDLQEEDGIEILKICPVCNTGNHEHAAYCIKCGNKFE